MEEAFLRFPHLSERIFDSVDNKSLSNCKGVSKSWYDYLDAQKFLETRIIKSILIKSMTFKRFTFPRMWYDAGILVKETFYKCPMWDRGTSTMCKTQFKERTEWKEVKQHITSRHVESDGNIFEDFLKI